MERIISSTESQYFHYLHLYLHSFELIVQCHPLPGEYGEDLEMGFNDESETDLPGQRQVLRRPRLAQWHGEIFNTNFENRKTVYVSRVLREAGGNPPQTRHRPGEQHHPHSHTLHLCLRKIDDDNSGEHGRP